MALPGYLWLTDDQGHRMKGPVTVEGREESAEIIGFEHGVYIPSDRDTGVLTGTRKHEPFVITKDFCQLSPLLYKACASGQTLSKAELSWYRINKQGEEEEYFRHTLDDVKVVAIRPQVNDVKEHRQENQGHREAVHLRYSRISWTYLDGNISTSDQWNKRNGL